jgi:hypothetical protein
MFGAFLFLWGNSYLILNGAQKPSVE